MGEVERGGVYKGGAGAACMSRTAGGWARHSVQCWLEQVGLGLGRETLRSGEGCHHNVQFNSKP